MGYFERKILSTVSDGLYTDKATFDRFKNLYFCNFADVNVDEFREVRNIVQGGPNKTHIVGFSCDFKIGTTVSLCNLLNEKSHHGCGIPL